MQELEQIIPIKHLLFDVPASEPQPEIKNRRIKVILETYDHYS